MSVTGVLSDLGGGLGTFVPSFFSALLNGFSTLFVDSNGLTNVGTIALVFIVIGITYKILPTVIGWLRLKVRSGRRKKARAK